MRTVNVHANDGYVLESFTSRWLWLAKWRAWRWVEQNEIPFFYLSTR